MTSLYAMTAEYRHLLQKDDLSPEDLEKLNSLPENIEDKTIQCAYVIKELQAKLAMTDEALKSVTAKKKRISKNIDDLKEYVVNGMLANEVEKIDKDPLFDVSLRHNAASVEEYSLDDLPEEYWNRTEKFTVDKKKIKNDIESLGVVIPGVRLIKKLSLQIK